MLADFHLSVTGYDLRVLSEDAFVGLPETRLGLVPDLGGSSRLPGSGSPWPGS